MEERKKTNEKKNENEWAKERIRKGATKKTNVKKKETNGKKKEYE